MRITTTLAAAAAIAITAGAANAGNPGLAIQEPAIAPIMIDTPVAGSSLNSGYVVLGLLAALVAASGSF